MKIHLKDYSPGILVTFIELIIISLILFVSYTIIDELSLLFIPLVILISGVLLINLVNKKTEGFYPEYIVLTFYDIVIALLIGSFVITSLYTQLFISFFIQMIVVLLIINYNALKKNTDAAISETIDKQTDLGRPKSAIEKVPEDYFKIHKTIKKIKARSIIAILLLSISIYSVWIIPYKEENEKKVYKVTQDLLVINKINSISDSLFNMNNNMDIMKNNMKQMEANLIQITDSIQSIKKSLRNLQKNINK